MLTAHTDARTPRPARADRPRPDMSAVAVFAAFVVGRIIIDNVEELILRERETIARCVSRLTAGPQGPQLDLATALRDVADVNRAFANPALGVTPRPGWRYRATLVYKPGLGQEAFFRALRLGPRLAAMMGTVCVDIEEVRLASRAATIVEDAPHAASFGVGNAVEGSSTRAVTNAITGDGEPEPEREADGLDADGYDFVGGPCRRATLAEFYTLIRPALHRIGVDATPAAARQAREARLSARAPDRPPSIASDADTPTDASSADDGGDDSVCAICMDGTLEVVTKCGHAYCEECYLRWLAVSRSRECPLCRQRLGRYDAYALVGEEELEESSREGDGGLDAGVSARDAGHGAEWLVGRLASLPPVAEEADGRRARVANLLRRLRERQEGKEEADLLDGSGTRAAR